ANVICLDVLRALSRSDAAFAALADEISAAPDPRTRRLIESARTILADPARAESAARSTVEALALGMQASLMTRFSDPSAAEAFCGSRLGTPSNSVPGGVTPGGGRTLGTLASGNHGSIIERARLRLG